MDSRPSRRYGRAVTLEESLAAHLDAIRRRDLAALAATVAPDEVVLVTARGEVFTTTERFLALHRDRFASTTWSIATELPHHRVGADLATCVLKLDYRDAPDVRQESILSLVFRRVGDRWLLVQDQNTPIRS